MFFFFDQPQECYLAYFDILGYKSFFESKDFDASTFFDTINSALEDVKKGINIESSLNHIDIKYRVYSDNFLFYIEDNDNEQQALIALSRLVSLIQKRLLEKYSLLIRGGITKGDFRFNKELIFGKGLIDVYTLESTKAIYPRVIFSNDTFVKDTLEYLKNEGFIEKDEDGYYYVQFLYQTGTEVSYEILARNITKLVNINCRYKNLTDTKKIAEKEKLITKYLWLVTRFNSYATNTTCKIGYDISVNPRVLKFEIKSKVVSVQKINVNNLENVLLANSAV